MDLVDFILNLAGLLLWLSWRAVHLDAPSRPTGVSLISTLKPAGARSSRRWTALVGLLLLLILRSVLYWMTSPSSHWIPRVALGATGLRFGHPTWPLLLLYSFVSFGWMLANYYLWLLLLTMVTRGFPPSEPVHRLIRAQLGPVGRWPVIVQAPLPLVVMGLLWFALAAPAAHLGLAPLASGRDVVWRQALVVGLGVYLSWQYLIAALLLAYIFNSYVYVGNSAVWHFLGLTGASLVRPLRWLPLTLGKVDLAPLIGIVLVLVGGHYAGLGLTYWFVHPPFAP